MTNRSDRVNHTNDRVMVPVRKTESGYEDVPYHSAALPQTHPDRLSSIATLFGIRSAPPESCNVLEIGCGDGTNVLGMAYSLPGGLFVGIDSSHAGITKARNTAEKCGIRNASFLEQDILQEIRSNCLFDYIICHGVFSWVARPVQDRIFQICRSHLAANGVAYISYNTLPGWSKREGVRKLMCFHSRTFSDPVERLNASNEIVRVFAAALRGGSANVRAFRGELERAASATPWYSYHEYLEPVNDPVYISEFIERADRYGLAFLGESPVWKMMPFRVPMELRRILERMETDICDLQQYLDFLTLRPFRQTLLVPATSSWSYFISPEILVSFFIESLISATTSCVDVCAKKAETYVTRRGNVYVTDDPMIKVAIAVLSERAPAYVPFMELYKSVFEQIPRTGSNDMIVLAEKLLGGYLQSGVIELHVWQPKIANCVSRCPVASSFARIQALRQSRVTNLQHRTCELSEGERACLLSCDGSELDEHAPSEIIKRLHREALLLS